MPYHGMTAGGRMFMRPRSTILALCVGVALASGCGDSAFLPGDETGLVRLAVSGLPSGTPSAGSAVISGPNIGTITMPLTSTVTVDTVPVGVYQVVYTPPAGYAMAAGESNQFEVSVAADEMTDISVAVVQATGELSITTSGFSAGGSGGSVAVLRTDVGGQTPNTVNLSANGTTRVSRVPGTYSVTYAPPSGYSLAAGQQNPRTVQVNADQTASVSFAVQADQTASPGTLSITTAGFASGTTNVGSVSVLRVDLAGQSPTTTTLNASAATNLTLPPGSYRVTYNAPSGYRLTSGQPNPRDVSVSSNATVSLAYTVEQYTAPAAVLFHSDFGTAQGTSAAALLDSGKQVPWTDQIGNGRGNEVVSSAGLDFPSSNVLRVVATGSSGGSAAAQTIRLLNRVTIPEVGQSLYYRWYFRMTTPDSFNGDTNTHPIQDAGPGDQNWLFRLSSSSNGTYNAQFRIGSNADWNNSQWGTNLSLQKNVTYRIEMQIHRIGASTFNMHARIYNSAGTLLYDDDDFRNANNSGSLAGNPTLSFVNPNYLHGMTAGFNGLSSGSGYPVTLYYQGAFCIRTDTWCGPYSGGI